MGSLWPTFNDQPKQTTPGIILKEQAQALDAQFQGRIAGDLKIKCSTESVSCVFFIVSTPLQYRHKLFECGYKMFEIYPVDIRLEDELAIDVRDNSREEWVIEVSGNPDTVRMSGELYLRIPNEPELMSVLSCIFTSRKTCNIIQSLSQHLGV